MKLPKVSEKKLSIFATLYFMFGVIFAILFALYYKWPVVGYFSPGFFMVVFSWPFQTIGFIGDLMYYGFSGKPV